MNKNILIVFLVFLNILLGAFVLAAEPGGGDAGQSEPPLPPIPFGSVTASFDPTSKTVNESGGIQNIPCIKLSDPASTGVTIHWQVSGGSATFGEDYDNNSSFCGGSPNCWFFFPEDATEICGVIEIIDDDLNEPDENAIFTLIDSPGLPDWIILVEDEFNLNIIDNDTSNNEVEINFDPVKKTANEDVGPFVMAVDIKLSSILLVPVTVSWSVTGGTAMEGIDYSTSGLNPLVIEPGFMSDSFGITIIDDFIYEGDETTTFHFTVQNPPPNLVIGEDDFTLEIIDDESPSAPSPNVEFLEKAPEVDEGAGSRTVYVSISEPPAKKVSVGCKARNNTASGGASCNSSGVDYISTSRVLTWEAGDKSSKPFSVTICDDSSYEGDETLYLSLSDPNGVNIVGSDVLLTIADNDSPPPLPEVSFDPTTATVDEGIGNINVHVKLSEAIQNGFTINLGLSGTAKEGTDYNIGASALAFNSGDRDKYFTINVIDDSVVEDVETAILTISTPYAGVEVVGNQFSLNINDNDFSQPSFQFISPQSEAEIDGTVTIKGNVEDALSVALYYQLPQSNTPIYIGSCSNTGANTWQYSWNTLSAPNGYYKLFPLVTNQYGSYYGSGRYVTVRNAVVAEEEEEQLIEEIEKGEEEIRIAEEEITAEEEIIKIDLSEKAEDLYEKIIAILKEEIKKTVSSIMRGELEEVKTEMEKDIEEVMEKIRATEGLKEEIRKLEGLKGITERDIELTSSQLKELEGLKATAEGERKEKISILERIIKDRAEVQSIKLEEVNKKLTPLKGKLAGLERVKDEIKEKIIKRIIALAKPAERVAEEEQIYLISVIKKEMEAEIISSLDQFESTISEKERTRIKGERLSIEDSDNDGLNNREEIRIGTELLNPDTDGDGFLDGTEYIAGYDPLNPSPADKVTYKDPRKIKPIKEDVYSVERIEIVDLSTGEKGIQIEGKGLPNSFVTIYVYSSAVVMTTRVDLNGNWMIVLDKPLADEKHEVYATVTNNRGEITARSDPFVFVKSGDKLAALTLASVTEGGASSPTEALQRIFFLVTISLIILTVGIAIVSISFFAKKRERTKG